MASADGGGGIPRGMPGKDRGGGARGGGGGGGKGERGGGGGRGGGMEPRLVNLSKRMSWLLRHGIVEAGISMEEDGTVAVADMLALKQFRGDTLADVLSVVERNEKKRFAIFGSGDSMKIRAQQGHSKGVAERVQTDLLLDAIETPPSVCIHGTYLKAFESIREQGLKTMTRKHIHFTDMEAPQDQQAVSGFRASCEILIHIDVAAAMRDGIKFHRSGNGVILSSGAGGVIGPKYFAKVTTIDGDELEWR